MQYKPYNLALFEKYLQDEVGISKNTLRFYRSDLAHFSGWLILTVKRIGLYVESLSEAIPYLTSSLVREYKESLTQNQTPKTTINRKLSTLRHFARFLKASNILDFDFMQEITNVSKAKRMPKPKESDLIKDFREHLESQKTSRNTIKNYLSDVRHFLTWLEAQNV
jgi:site-specific recombinase XerD